MGNEGEGREEGEMKVKGEKKRLGKGNEDGNVKGGEGIDTRKRKEGKGKEEMRK